MALLKSNIATGVKPVQTPISGLLAKMLYDYVTTTALAAGDIIDLGPIPEDLAPVDCMLVAEDLDTNVAPTITLSVGILNDDKSDLATTLISTSTVGQAGGVARATTNSTYLSGASSSERHLGIKVAAGPATAAAAGKKLAVVLDVQP